MGRYTHKIAISNHRLKAIADGNVSFSYKDYAHGSVTKLMTLEADEFLRRFCLHILPPKFNYVASFGGVKMRHYGFLSSRAKQKLKIEQMKQGISTAINSSKIEKKGYKEITKNQLGFDVDQCVCCKKGRMITVMQFMPNAPPKQINDKRKNQINNTL